MLDSQAYIRFLWQWLLSLNGLGQLDANEYLVLDEYRRVTGTV